MGAEAIRQPRDLSLPGDIWPVLEQHFKTDEVLANLSPQGEQLFRTEVLEAIRKSITSNDLRPIQEVLEAWYRTLVLIKDPAFSKKVQWALDNPPKREAGRDAKDFRREIGL
jgi:hypothetical protein